MKIVVTTLHALSISVTCFRLWYRTRKRQLWWEDCWAGIALVAETVSLISVWFISNPTGRTIACWNLMVAFTICLWSARLSIVCSIVRISPEGWKMRKMAITSAALFLVMFLSLLFQKIYCCARDTWWYTLEPITCPLGTVVIALQLSTDVISDILLVILPIQLVRERSVPRDQRIILMSVFSSSILISLISVVHFVFMIEPGIYVQTITAQLEIALSVIVCDLLVVVAWIYRLLKRKKLGFTQEPTTIVSGTAYFTTVLDMAGLEHPGQWSFAEGGRTSIPQDAIEGQKLHCAPEIEQS